jgi:hypothetical protein
MINIIEWKEIEHLEGNISYHEWIKETLEKEKHCKVQILKQGISIEAPTRQQLIVDNFFLYLFAVSIERNSERAYRKVVDINR